MAADIVERDVYRGRERVSHRAGVRVPISVHAAGSFRGHSPPRCNMVRPTRLNANAAPFQPKTLANQALQDAFAPRQESTAAKEFKAKVAAKVKGPKRPSAIGKKPAVKAGGARVARRPIPARTHRDEDVVEQGSPDMRPLAVMRAAAQRRTAKASAKVHVRPAHAATLVSTRLRPRK